MTKKFKAGSLDSAKGPYLLQRTYLEPSEHFLSEERKRFRAIATEQKISMKILSNCENGFVLSFVNEGDKKRFMHHAFEVQNPAELCHFLCTFRKGATSAYKYSWSLIVLTMMHDNGMRGEIEVNGDEVCISFDRIAAFQLFKQAYEEGVIAREIEKVLGTSMQGASPSPEV